MSKKKTRTFETSPPKSDKVVIKIDNLELLRRSRNLMHFEAQKRLRSNVVESKKKKPPKYKKAMYDYDDLA